jgi:hypothetical protein
MICRNCDVVGVLAHANGKPYYFCRSCRTEIMLEEVVAPKQVPTPAMSEQLEFEFSMDDINWLQGFKTP